MNFFNVLGSGWLILWFLGCSVPPSPLFNIQSLPEMTAVPGLTTGPHGEPVLVYVESTKGTHRLVHQSWNGQGWDSPQLITEDSLMLVNWADRPSLAFHATGQAYAHWLRLDQRGDFAYSIQTVRSADGGKSWSDSHQPHRDTAIAEHGFAVWMPYEGGAGLAWLDGRDFDGHPDPSKARMEVRLAHWPNDEYWSEEVVLDSSACTCCPMATVAHAGGAYELVYRDRYDGEIRDFSRMLIKPETHVSTLPVALHPDQWEIAACPVNGAAICQNDQRTLAVWYTGANDQPSVRLAWRPSNQWDFNAPMDLHEHTPLGRVTATTDDRGQFYALWLETNETGGVAWMGHRWDADGRPLTKGPQVLIPASESRAGGFPTAIGLEKGVLVAWTNPFPEPHVMTAVWQ